MLQRKKLKSSSHGSHVVCYWDIEEPTFLKISFDSKIRHKQQPNRKRNLCQVLQIFIIYL